MYTRIEALVASRYRMIWRGPTEIKRFVVSDKMLDLGLRLPEDGFHNALFCNRAPEGRFYFTQHGWETIGIHLHAWLKKEYPDVELRTVSSHKEPYWEDPLQAYITI